MTRAGLHTGYIYSSTTYTVGGLLCNTGHEFRIPRPGDGDPYSKPLFDD